MSTKLKILLVEDDADDIELLEEALADNKVIYDLDVIMQGDQVMPHLSTTANIPDIIILDFNIPKLHGKEILHLIKSSEIFNKIPLIVLTTSAAKEDMEFALRLGAAHFITKPTSIEDFTTTVNTILRTASVEQNNKS